MISKEEFHAFLKEENIRYDKDIDIHFASDASFLTLGKPFAAVFPKSEAEVVKITNFSIKHQIPITPRAMGSSTAGASVADENSILMVVDRLGACDKWGVRKLVPSVRFVDKCFNPSEIQPEDDRELYAVVGAGLSTDELDKYLKSRNYHTAVVPSSGWSSIAGNFATNAGGNGTPKYGTFKDIIGYLKLVVADKNEAKVLEITDKKEIEALGGFQGTLGIITEIGVLVVPIIKDSEMANVVLSYESDDIEKLGETMGSLIEETQKNCVFLNAEFLFIDPLLLSADDPLWKNQELSEFFKVDKGKRKMVLLYQGEKSGLTNLKPTVEKYQLVNYKEISVSGMKTMLNVRKAATGKSTARVAIPGFEDIYVTKPSKLGIVLKKIFEMCEGKLPGRPIGHQYVDGIVIHYRPQALVNREDYLEAWKLTQELNDEIIGNKKYFTDKRREHGLGLELFALSDENRRKELLHFKEKYDPNNLFNPHLMVENPVVKFVGQEFKI